MSKYTHILLDLDNTLFNFDACESAALKTLFTAICGDVKEAYIDIYHQHNMVCWQQVERGELAIDDVNKRRVKDTMNSLKDIGVILNLEQSKAEELLVKALSDNDILFDGALDLVEDLSEKYTLIAITNGFDQVKTSHMQTSGLTFYFDAVFTSQAVGFSKPNPKFFDAVFKSIGVEKSKCLVVGDGLGSDMKGARLYGLDACWLNLKGLTVKNKTFQYQVNNYNDLRELLLNDE